MSSIDGTAATFQGAETGIRVNVDEVAALGGGFVVLGNGASGVDATTGAQLQSVTVVGDLASTAAASSTAVGTQANVATGATFSTAVGRLASVSATGTRSTVVGDAAASTAADSTVVGMTAASSSNTGLALGFGAVAADWVLNTSSPLAIQVGSGAPGAGTSALAGATAAGVTAVALRVRINGTNYLINLYPDQ